MHITNTSNLPVESIEMEYPLLVESYGFVEDSGGAGKYRGGLGLRRVVRPVGHFAYAPECRWLVGPILTKLAGLPLCDDPQGVDRAQVHRQVAPDVVAFFKKYLAEE